MPHSKSAKKRVRQNAADRLRNRSAKSTLRTTLKKFNAAVKQGDADAAGTAYKNAQKTVDSSARKGIVNKGTAARVKSRLAAQLKKTKTAKTAE